MCINPGILASGELVGCRKCWQCKEVRINDWLGRNIAESKTAKQCHFVTLTYGEDMVYGGADHERSVTLTYSDVQKFFKKLRKAKFRFRYFAIGEYGSLKGRAHWHILMYWKSAPPKFRLNVREASEFWEHGLVRWEDIKNGVGAVRYACKYIQKDIGDPERQGHIAMSKKPPLGTEYFEDLARRYVEAGLAPQDLLYGWRDVKDKKGEKLRFMMRGVVAESFVRKYLQVWEIAHPGEHAPWSQAVEDVLDKITRREWLTPREEPAWAKPVFPWLPVPQGAGGVLIDERRNAYYCVVSGVNYYWSYGEDGERAWTREIVSESVSDARRENERKELLRKEALKVQYQQKWGDKVAPRPPAEWRSPMQRKGWRQ